MFKKQPRKRCLGCPRSASLKPNFYLDSFFFETQSREFPPKFCEEKQWYQEKTCHRRRVEVIVTVCIEVSKVMFLHLPVCPQGGEVCLSACWDTTPSPTPLGAGTPPPGAAPPPPSRRLLLRRYASYRNAFLFQFAIRSFFERGC